MSCLTKALKKKIAELRIPEEQAHCLLALLDVLKKHDSATYSHCLRVGLMGVEVAEFLNLNPKPLFYAGLLHDFGKIGVNPRILRKKTSFSQADRAAVRKHTITGYLFLRKLYPFSADILVRHHPLEEVPKTVFDEELIERYAGLLSLVDFFDALTTRNDSNNKEFGIDIKDEKQVRAIIIQYRREQEGLINALFERRIFKV